MDCSPPAPLSVEFSRQESWSGLPFPFPGDLPDPGIKPGSPALAGGFFTSSSLSLLGEEPHCCQWQDGPGFPGIGPLKGHAGWSVCPFYSEPGGSGSAGRAAANEASRAGQAAQRRKALDWGTLAPERACSRASCRSLPSGFPHPGGAGPEEEARRAPATDPSQHEAPVRGQAHGECGPWDHVQAASARAARRGEQPGPRPLAQDGGSLS